MNKRQLKKLRDMNIELLESLLQAYSSVANYCKTHGLPLSFDQKLAYFLSHSKSLIQEINEEIQLPLIPQYSAIRRKVTDHKSDEEVTEPRARH